MIIETLSGLDSQDAVEMKKMPDGFDNIPSPSIKNSSGEKVPALPAVSPTDINYNRNLAYLRSCSELEREIDESESNESCNDSSNDNSSALEEGDIPDSARAVSSLLQTPVFKKKNKIQIESCVPLLNH